MKGLKTRVVAKAAEAVLAERQVCCCPQGVQRPALVPTEAETGQLENLENPRVEPQFPIAWACGLVG